MKITALKPKFYAMHSIMRAISRIEFSPAGLGLDIQDIAIEIASNNPGSEEIVEEVKKILQDQDFVDSLITVEQDQILMEGTDDKV